MGLSQKLGGKKGGDDLRVGATVVVRVGFCGNEGNGGVRRAARLENRGKS